MNQQLANEPFSVQNSLVKTPSIIIMHGCLDGRSMYHEDKDKSHFLIMIEGDH